MYVIYYFLQNVVTKETEIVPSDRFLGDINDRIALNGNIYIITDYAEEYTE